MKKIWLSLLLSVFTLGLWAQPASNPREKMEVLFYFLQNYYLEPVDLDEAAENGIRAILKELDPHSYYLSLKELKASEEQLVGNFEGIGIQFNIHNDTLLVVSPISGGPSEKVGIRSGDKIVRINDTLIAGRPISNQDVYRWLRGPKGSQVKLGILRRGEKKPMDFTVTRDKIPVFSLDAAYMASPTTGYIKLNRFSETTVREFKEALGKLKARGAFNLILDLQDNAGGYLNAAVELADEFLKSGELIVYTEGRTEKRTDYKATMRGGFETGRVVVLINEGSASASEIVSGAIQDLDRGVIIGRRSFGKGLVQNTFPLPDGSAVRLTTARYFTPSGRFIQAPYDGGTEKYFEDLYGRFRNGELTQPEQIKFPDSLQYRTRKKRIVYGGGGIMPDYFIPLDTTFLTDFLTEVSRKNLMYDFSITFVDDQRERLMSTYPTFKVFQEKFKASSQLWPEFMKACKAKGITPEAKEVETSKAWMETRLLALVAQNLYGRDAFFEVINQTDSAYLKALELLEKGWPNFVD